MAEAPTKTRRKRVSDERILDGACTEFARAGFTGASMEAIAAAARTTKVTLYARFGSKEELMNAAVSREAGLLLAQLLRAYATDPTIDLRRRLHVYVDAYFAYAAQRPDGLRLMFADAATHPVAQELQTQITDSIAKLIATWFERDEPTESHLILAALISGAVHNGAGLITAAGISVAKAARITEQFLAGALGTL